MALKFSYGALTPDKINGAFGPNVALVGDPAIDSKTLFDGGYGAGRIATLTTSTLAADSGKNKPALIPLDGASGKRAFGAFVNGGGNYAESLGPSGSKKMSVARAKVAFDVINETGQLAAYVAAPTKAYAIGDPLYAGCAKTNTVGQWTSDAPVDGAGAAVANPEIVGLTLHVPTATEAYLGVATSF